MITEKLGKGLRALRGLARGRESHVAEVWGEAGSTWRVGGNLHWTELPRVQARINRRVSGRPEVNPYEHTIARYWRASLPFARVLTLGCGEGELERGLARLGFATRHDALDLAPAAIERARAAAAAAGLDHIQYRVADLNRVSLEPAAYDCVLGAHSVHHLEALEHVLAETARALGPGGWLFLNEYVGPSRFQWTDRQLEVVNGLLAALPARFRRNLARPGTLKTRIGRPSVLRMRLVDPSEAVRSAEILPLLPSYFEVVEVAGYGGTVLAVLLHEIAGNFADTEPGGAELLEAICDLEDALIACGDLTHDFAVVVARKP